MGGGPEQFDLVMFGEGVPKVRPGSYYWLDLAARGQSRGFAALAGSAKSGGVLAARDLSGRFLAELGTAQRIAMSVKGRPVFGVDVPEAVDAFRALQACYAGLLQEWKVDPARVVAPALGPATSFSDYPNPGSVFAQLLILPTPPDGSRLPVVPRAPTDWIGSLDYPSEALRQERGGTVVVVLSVDPSGAVGDCRVVVTSQFAPLDEQTCKQMRARARYPKSDSPTLRQAIERVRWVMPRL